jgi:hypothetical protein
MDDNFDKFFGMEHGRDCGHTDEEHRRMQEIIEHEMEESDKYKGEAAVMLASVLQDPQFSQDYINNHPVFKVTLQMLTMLIEQQGLVAIQQLPGIVEMVKVVIGLVLVSEGISAPGAISPNPVKPSEVPDIFKGLELPGLDEL